MVDYQRNTKVPAVLAAARPRGPARADGRPPGRRYGYLASWLDFSLLSGVGASLRNRPPQY